VARQTRSQRRARRDSADPSGGALAASGGAASAGAPPVSEPKPPTAADSAAGPAASRGGVPGIRFIRESTAELKKVEWPTQAQVVAGTTVVLMACIIVGVFLYGNDQLWKFVVEKIVIR
jgi:preprotein translocase SecE subunit